MSNRDEYVEQFSLIRELRDRYMSLRFPGVAPVASGAITVNDTGGNITVTIAGTAVTTAWATSNAATATAIITAINGNATASKIVTAATGGSGVVYLTAKAPGPAGRSITIVLSGGTTGGSTFSGSATGTLQGGGGQLGSSLPPISTLTFSSATGTVGAVINGTSITVAVGATDYATAQLFVAAVNASAVVSGWVTASFGTNTSTLANATVILQVVPGYMGTVTIVPTASTVTVDVSPLSVLSSGLRAFPENKGIAGVYQLNTGYYMVILKDSFTQLTDVSFRFSANSATQGTVVLPAAVKPWVVSEAVSSVSTGYLLLAGLQASDTVTVMGSTFTAVASGATGSQFNVGGNDAATAVNLAAIVNTTLSSQGITATAIATAPAGSNGGSVLFTSATANAGLTASSAVRSLCFPASGSMANGGGIVFCTLANAGVVPTENSSVVTLIANFILKNN